MSKILIVDDSPDLVAFLKILLERKGNEVETAATGAELKAKLLVFTPHVILLDVNLRNESGRDICMEIKKNKLTNHIRVILISASSVLLQNYSECEADAVIEKPFDTIMLFSTIERILMPLPWIVAPETYFNPSHQLRKI